MLKVQEFLSKEGLAALEERYKIIAKRHEQYPNLVLLKYNQLESPMHEPIVQECRGLILDEASNWEIVSFPFTKFFNHGEPLAAPINWSGAKVQEKLDGSLVVMYHYAGQWHVASSGSPDASGTVEPHKITFRELFWNTFKEHGYSLPTDTDLVLMYELCTPYNKVVVHHTQNQLILIGARNRVTLKEIDIYNLDVPYRKVRQFDLRNIYDIIRTFGDINPIEQEGYVVVDLDFNRVKIKHPKYVALHHFRDTLSLRGLVEVVRSGESEEVKSYFPEMAKFIDEIEMRYHKLIEELYGFYESIKGIESQKEFAAKALQSQCSGALFTLRAGKVKSLEEYFASVHVDKLIELLKLKELYDVR